MVSIVILGNCAVIGIETDFPASWIKPYDQLGSDSITVGGMMLLDRSATRASIETGPYFGVVNASGDEEKTLES